CSMMAAFMAPALVPLTASNSSRPSSISASSTPQVKAPCEPPPCRARLTRLVGFMLLGSPSRRRYLRRRARQRRRQRHYGQGWGRASVAKTPGRHSLDAFDRTARFLGADLLHVSAVRRPHGPRAGLVAQLDVRRAVGGPAG